MELMIMLVLVGTSIWVLVDASNIGARKGLLPGSVCDMGPGGWFAVCLLMWIVGFPAYLMTRSQIIAALRRPLPAKYRGAIPKKGGWYDPVDEWEKQQKLASPPPAPARVSPPSASKQATISIATIDCPLCSRKIPAIAIRIGSNACPQCSGTFEAQST